MRSTTNGQVRLTDRQRELLAVIRVVDNVAIFDSDERIPDWPALKKVMVALGGKWRIRKGFEFAEDVDAAELVRLAKETGEIVDPKAADFYETPEWLAVRLASLAHVKAGDRVLEPSAGNGALARAAINEGGTVTCVEIREEACRLLRALGLETRTSDFLLLTPGDFPARFDAVVMNPPFSRGADITHVTHAMRFLRPGGHLAAIMSAGVAYRSSASARAFRELVAANGGRISPCPDGTFREAGTMVRTVTVEMQRPG